MSGALTSAERVILDYLAATNAGLSDTRAILDALRELVTARKALERIAWPEFEKDANGRPVGCRCGHIYEMCNAVNAARWCGGDALRAQSIARHTLGYVSDLGLITPKGQARYDELRALPSGGGGTKP